MLGYQMNCELMLFKLASDTLSVILTKKWSTFSRIAYFQQDKYIFESWHVKISEALEYLRLLIIVFRVLKQMSSTVVIKLTEYRNIMFIHTSLQSVISCDQPSVCT